MGMVERLDKVGAGFDASKWTNLSGRQPHFNPWDGVSLDKSVQVTYNHMHVS
jgi:hypothetical protein